MTKPPSTTPKYLMCARALALASGLGGGLVGCGGSLTNDTKHDAAPTAYDGGFMGVRINPGVDAEPPSPYDGGAVGVRINPDAATRSDASPGKPYDGGFFGVRINPDAR